jgi:hypothetical protein
MGTAESRLTLSSSDEHSARFITHLRGVGAMKFIKLCVFSLVMIFGTSGLAMVSQEAEAGCGRFGCR